MEDRLKEKSERREGARTQGQENSKSLRAERAEQQWVGERENWVCVTLSGSPFIKFNSRLSLGSSLDPDDNFLSVQPGIDQPGETHLADQKRAAPETLITHYFYFAFIYFIAPSYTDKLFCFSTNFKRSLWLCGQRATETAVEIGWITKHSLCARAFCLSSVFLASGSDRTRFTRRILLPEWGFLKFIVHSITLYEP